MKTISFDIRFNFYQNNFSLSSEQACKELHVFTFMTVVVDYYMLIRSMIKDLPNQLSLLKVKM
jgi:hypothetical protein